jgi:hypothetical protein
MGALGYTMFCENGHIVDIVQHHEISQYDESQMYCPVHGCAPMFDGDGDDCCTCIKRSPCLCGSENFREVCEWGDPDYQDNDGAGPVSREPIGKDEFVSDRQATVVVFEMGEERCVTGKLVVEIEKYDVTKLFEE